MPTYDYVCDACKHKYELFQSMSAKPVKKCPECGANKARRLIGAGAGLIFKGGGFYITDYRDKSYGEAAKKDSSGDSKPADSKSADSKPATASASDSPAAAKTPASPPPTPAAPPATPAPAPKPAAKSATSKRPSRGK